MTGEPEQPGIPPPTRGPKRPAGLLWQAAAVVGLLVLLGLFWKTIVDALADEFPETLTDSDSVHMVYSLILLTLIGFSVAAGLMFGGWRHRVGTAVKQAAAWVAIVAVLVVGYSYRSELGAVKDRVVGELAPHRAMEDSPGVIKIRRGRGRHFRVEASVDGVPVRFLIDTGASDVVLSPRDARRLGFDTGRLAYTRQYSTANGVVAGAPVRIGEIRIGSITVRNPRASVNGADMGGSLLGMSFLDKLGGYDVRRDTLTIRR